MLHVFDMCLLVCEGTLPASFAPPPPSFSPLIFAEPPPVPVALLLLFACVVPLLAPVADVKPPPTFTNLG